MAYLLGLGVDLVLEGRRRSDPLVTHADRLSRYVDFSAIFFRRHTYKEVCQALLGERVPNLDVFAGGGEGQHHTAEFFTVCACPGSSGVHAFAQSWQVTPGGKPAQVWAFPPESDVAACIRKIKEERVECLLVVPNSSKFWEPLVAALGNPALRKAVTVPYQRGQYCLGSQAPVAWRAEKRKFSFVVHRVS